MSKIPKFKKFLWWEKNSVHVVGQDDRDLSKLETLVWDPKNSLQDQHIDQFLVIARYFVFMCFCGGGIGNIISCDVYN